MLGSTPDTRVVSDEIGSTPPAGWDLWSWVIDPAYGPGPVRPCVEELWKLHTVHAEVGNGGLWQAFYNLDQDFIDASAQLQRDIAAVHHADLLARAGGLMGALPREGAARQAAAARVEPGDLNALDEAWYRDEELEPIVEAYIRAHAGELLPSSA